MNENEIRKAGESLRQLVQATLGEMTKPGKNLDPDEERSRQAALTGVDLLVNLFVDINRAASALERLASSYEEEHK